MENQIPTVKKTNLTFIEAFEFMLAGKMIYRLEWGNDDYCFTNDGWVSINRNGNTNRWIINDGDYEANDWQYR